MAALVAERRHIQGELMRAHMQLKVAMQKCSRILKGKDKKKK
jgi:hypothetical protein